MQTVGEEARSRRKWVGIAALALLPIVAIIVAVVATSGNSGTAPPKKPFTRPAPAQVGSLVATVTRSSDLRAAPGGRSLAKINSRTEFGGPQIVLVVRRTPGWLGVISPLVGNGRIGWIPESVATLGRVRVQLQVSLAAHRLTVLQGNSVLERYQVAVGAQGSPTPTGRFDVTDRLITHNPAGPYGCCILALSARSPHAIQGWTGGDRIAIHSTPDAGSIGHSITHGCVRVTLDHGRWLLDHIPLGTPALISS
jgi:lipoprotein-anchoring transpeptidase ErfK/SrfK